VIAVIDAEGFRIGVGIIVVNHQGDVLWARRLGQRAWQFPQGGLQSKETAEQALFRELYEELGLERKDVKLLGCTKAWLHYWLPLKLRRSHLKPFCVGQKQKWFLLHLLSDPRKIHFDSTCSPEFDCWRWAPYWYPIQQVIAFKRHVYQHALEELSMLLPKKSPSYRPAMQKFITSNTLVLEEELK